jgi:hypothetical protein
MPEYLSVSQYEIVEAAARRHVPNRIVTAFAPVTFERVGYPTRVTDDAELAKYADAMQEQRFEAVWQEKIKALSEQELGLLSEALAITAAYTRERLGQAILPRGSLLSSLNVFRAFEAVYGMASPKPAVLEIGPGSGYLGLLLVLGGYRYVGFEVTQAFYLYQSGLLQSVPGADFAELAKGRGPEAEQSLASRKVIHVPWWEVERIPQFDAVTCNAVLSEMHPMALHFLLKQARRAFEQNRPQLAFLFHDWGFSEANLPAWYVNASFHQHGFGLLHRDDRITAYGPMSAHNLHYARFPSIAYPPNVDVALLRNYGDMPVSSVWEPYDCRSPVDPISSALQRNNSSAWAHHFEDLKAVYRALGVDPDAESRDEQFLRSCIP